MIEFREAIRRIIEPIPSGRFFDSHYVIDQLIRNYSDEYIVFVSRFATGQSPTLTAHRQIGMSIRDGATDLVEERDGELSWSQTIHATNAPCALWKRRES